MKNILATVVLLSAAAAPGFALSPSMRTATPTRPNVRQQTTFEGAWLGEIVGSSDNQCVLLEIFGPAEQPSSEAQDVLRATTVGTQLRLELTEEQATFEGRMHPEGAEIIGRWKQGDTESWLVFRRLASPSENT